jgi:NifB/MoaA-like Fe-S oxidoreductase
MRVFTKEECRQVIEQVENWQQRLYKEKGTRFVYAADELYLKAELPLPAYESYEEFPQLENGVGMCALLDFEVCDIIAREGKRLAKRYVQEC